MNKITHKKSEWKSKQDLEKPHKEAKVQNKFTKG